MELFSTPGENLTQPILSPAKLLQRQIFTRRKTSEKSSESHITLSHLTIPRVATNHCTVPIAHLAGCPADDRSRGSYWKPTRIKIGLELIRNHCIATR